MAEPEQPYDGDAPRDRATKAAARRQPAAEAPSPDLAAPLPTDPRGYLPGGPPREVREPGLLAYFANPGDAAAAAESLRQAGFAVSLERLQPQLTDRADLRQAPEPRVGLEDHLEAGMPVHPLAQTTTLVATSTAGHRRQQALEIVRRYGGDLGV